MTMGTAWYRYQYTHYTITYGLHVDTQLWNRGDLLRVRTTVAGTVYSGSVLCILLQPLYRTLVCWAHAPTFVVL